MSVEALVMRVERRDESVRREYESTGEPGGTFLRDVGLRLKS